jgi:surfeit locus 1 family protein
MRWGTIIAGVVTAAACGVMIKLGLWQLQRAAWKDGLLTQYAAAATLPQMAYPAIPYPARLPLFRKASGYCTAVTGSTATAGRNAKGQSGWSHIVTCGSGAEGPGMTVDIGWSRAPDNPVWKGGPVSGVIGQDPKALIRLISNQPLAPGLEASQPPSIEEIPNNHFGYAVQWFLFAAIAAVIFLIAAFYRKRAD